MRRERNAIAVPGARTRPRRWAWRYLPLALCASLVISCCPAPAGLAGAPTAFEARVADDSGGSWLAETVAGSRYRIPGRAPGPVGTAIYVEGRIGPDGTLAVDRTTSVEGY